MTGRWRSRGGVICLGLLVHYPEKPVRHPETYSPSLCSTVWRRRFEDVGLDRFPRRRGLLTGLSFRGSHVLRTARDR